MLLSFYRRSCFRAFSSATSLLPKIKDEASIAETESENLAIETSEPKDETSFPKFGEKASASVLVGVKADIKKIAGKLASLVREHEKDDSILIKATGTNAVNKAIKTMHVARQYLAERPGIHIGFYVNHMEKADKDRISQLQFLVRQIEPLQRDPSGMEEMWVSARVSGRRPTGRKMTLALDNAENAIVLAIGPRSVGNAVVSLAWARRMLHSKKLDAIAIPEMIRVSLKESEMETLSAIRLILKRVPYERLPVLDPDEPFEDNADESFIEDPKSE